MNSHDGAACSGGGGLKALGGKCGADVGGSSGDDALVVPDHWEGTGEEVGAITGTCSHSDIAIDGILAILPAEKEPSISLFGLKGVVKLVSTVSGGGVPCQSNVDAPADASDCSIDSIPCMGAFTWAANWASS